MHPLSTPTETSSFCSPDKANSLSSAAHPSVSSSALPSRIATRFGPSIDVRNRGVFKASPNAMQISAQQHFAVVRIWSGDCCREMSVNDARIFAEQLTAAASFAESQNV